MCIPLILECFEALFDGTLITPPFVVEPSSLEIEEGPQIAPRAALEAVQIEGVKPIVSTDETSSAKGLEHRKSDFDHLQRDPVTSLDRDGDGSLDGYKKSDESASSITEAETDSEDELSFLSSESPCALDTVDRDGEISSLSENGKRLRFSNFDGNDCITIHEVPRLVEPKDTWLTLEECQAIKATAMEPVRWYRRHAPEYIESIRILSDPNSTNSDIKEQLDVLTIHSDTTRGIEKYISKVLSAPRRRAIQAVLEEQEKLREATRMQQEQNINNDDRLRQVSMAASEFNRTFAARIGEYDHMVALKVSRARGRKKPSTVCLRSTRQ